MSKRNPIAKIVRLREIRERAARAEMAQALGEESEAERALRVAEDRRRAEREVAGLLRPAELRALHLQGYRLHEIVTDAAARHELARDRLASTRETWRLAAADLESAENLADRRRRAAAAAARTAAERALDDLQIARQERR